MAFARLSQLDQEKNDHAQRDPHIGQVEDERVPSPKMQVEEIRYLVAGEAVDEVSERPAQHQAERQPFRARTSPGEPEHRKAEEAGHAQQQPGRGPFIGR